MAWLSRAATGLQASNPRKARQSVGGNESSLRDAIRARGGARPADTSAPTDIEDNKASREKGSLDWLNLNAFAPKAMQNVIDRIRAGGLTSDAEEGELPQFKKNGDEASGGSSSSKGPRKSTSGLRSALQARGGVGRPLVTPSSPSASSEGKDNEKSPATTPLRTVAEEEEEKPRDNADKDVHADDVEARHDEQPLEEAKELVEDLDSGSAATARHNGEPIEDLDSGSAATARHNGEPIEDFDDRVRAESRHNEEPIEAQNKGASIESRCETQNTKANDLEEIIEADDTDEPDAFIEGIQEPIAADSSLRKSAEDETADVETPRSDIAEVHASIRRLEEAAGKLQIPMVLEIEESNQVSTAKVADVSEEPPRIRSISDDKTSADFQATTEPEVVNLKTGDTVSPEKAKAEAPPALPIPTPLMAASAASVRVASFKQAQQVASSEPVVVVSSYPQQVCPTTGTALLAPEPPRRPDQIDRDIGKLKELREFWGCKTSKGFAGPQMGGSRLSKVEAQATLQRLVAAGGDFDEVRRLRKLISELE